MSKRKPALIEPEPASDEAPVVVAEPIDPAGESFEVPPPVEETTDSPLEPAGSPEDEASEEVVGQALKKVVEAVLFASQKPVSSKELIAVFKGAADAAKENPASPAHAFAKLKAPQIQAAIEELEIDCAEARCTHEVRETAAGWQLVTKPEFSPWLRQLFPENRPARLSAPALETLAIIAYRQPITRADIEAVRGVAVDGVMQTLLDRSLVKIGGRAEVPGRPLLYETTQFFMEHFGLKDLEELPNASELRTISLPKAAVPEEEQPAGDSAPETNVDSNVETSSDAAATTEVEAAEDRPEEGSSPEPINEEAEAVEPALELSSGEEESFLPDPESEPESSTDSPAEMEPGEKDS